MILYLDTSAFVPLMISEQSSPLCADLWERADRVVTVRLTYVEACAALAMAHRLDRVTAEQVVAGRVLLDELWSAVDIIEFDPPLMSSAAAASASQGLRAYDAVHCAAAAELGADGAVAAAADARLLQAWSAVGLTAIDTNA